MGRPNLDETQIKEKKIQIIEEVEELLNMNDLSSITIRMISSKLGINSAALYRFFKDVEELKIYACVGKLKAYVDDCTKIEDKDPIEVYLRTWELFSTHAFANPDIFIHLFFSKHSDNLSDVIGQYYVLFPNELENLPFQLQTMLKESNVLHRNIMLLRPILKERLTDEEISLRNELIVSFFFSLLIEKQGKGDLVDNKIQTRKLLDACKLLLKT